MAAIARQPFAPLDGARLQSLTSLKNRQNAISPSSSAKRKAADVGDLDDSENVDPSSLFSKRSKGTADGFSKDLFKPSSSFVLTRAAPAAPVPSHLTSPVKAASPPRPRSILNPKSPAARLNTAAAKASPLSAPAGRSPTRGGKRIGILSRSRRRTASPFTRVDPPASGLSPAPFSLDAALKGTVAGYASPRPSAASAASPPLPSSLAADALSPELLLRDSSDPLKSSWFFDIHEDTPEQEMTNLLQHSTCTLDISSDEESELRARRERAEGRDKENIPPADDMSQTSARAAAAAARGKLGDLDMMAEEKQRDPLADLDVAAFYADGCDESTVVFVHEDEQDELPPPREPREHGSAPAPAPAPAPEPQLQQLEPALAVADGPVLSAVEEATPEEPELLRQEQALPGPAAASLDADVDALMGGAGGAAKMAAVLEPMEGTGEGFELWESGSAGGDVNDDGAPTPEPASPRSDTAEFPGREPDENACCC